MKKMGRPRKSTNDLLCKTIGLRFTSEDYEVLKNMAVLCDMNISDYCREAIEQYRIKAILRTEETS